MKTKATFLAIAAVSVLALPARAGFDPVALDYITSSNGYEVVWEWNVLVPFDCLAIEYVPGDDPQGDEGFADPRLTTTFGWDVFGDLPHKVYAAGDTRTSASSFSLHHTGARDSYGFEISAFDGDGFVQAWSVTFADGAYTKRTLEQSQAPPHPSSVPEPTTLLVLGAILAGGGFLRRRRRPTV